MKPALLSYHVGLGQILAKRYCAATNLFNLCLELGPSSTKGFSFDFLHQFPKPHRFEEQERPFQGVGAADTLRRIASFLSGPHAFHQRGEFFHKRLDHLQEERPISPHISQGGLPVDTFRGLALGLPFRDSLK